MSKTKSRDQISSSLRSEPRNGDVQEELSCNARLNTEESSCSQIDLTHRDNDSQQERHLLNTEHRAHAQDVNLMHESAVKMRSNFRDAAYSCETQQNPVNRQTTGIPVNVLEMELNSQDATCSDPVVKETNCIPGSAMTTTFNSQDASCSGNSKQYPVYDVRSNWSYSFEDPYELKTGMDCQGATHQTDTFSADMEDRYLHAHMEHHEATGTTQRRRGQRKDFSCHFSPRSLQEMRGAIENPDLIDTATDRSYHETPVIRHTNVMNRNVSGIEDSASVFQKDQFVTSHSSWLPDCNFQMNYNSQVNTRLVKSAQDTMTHRQNWMSEDALKMDFNSHYAACEAKYKQDPMIRQTILMPGRVARIEFNSQDATCSDPVIQGTNWIPGSAMTTTFNSQDASCSGNSKQYPVYDVRSNWSYSSEDPYSLRTGMDCQEATHQTDTFSADMEGRYLHAHTGHHEAEGTTQWSRGQRKGFSWHFPPPSIQKMSGASANPDLMDTATDRSYHETSVIRHTNWRNRRTAGIEEAAGLFQKTQDFVTPHSSWVPGSNFEMNYNSQVNTRLVKSAQDTMTHRPNWMSEDAMKMNFNSHYAACEAYYRQDPLLTQTNLMPGSLARQELNSQDARCSDPVIQGTNWIPGSAMATTCNSQDASCSGNAKPYPVYDVRLNCYYSSEDHHALKTKTDCQGATRQTDGFSADMEARYLHAHTEHHEAEGTTQGSREKRKYSSGCFSPTSIQEMSGAGANPDLIDTATDRSYLETHQNDRGYSAKSAKQKDSTKTLFQCKFCGKCFLQLSTLNKHMHIHFEKRWYQCSRCCASYRSEGRFRRHLLTHKND